MNRTPALRVIVTGLGLSAIGAIGLAVTARQFLSSPYPIDSNSGRSVFIDGGVLVSYEVFTAGGWPTVIGVGVVLLVAGLFLAAIHWHPTSGAAGASRAGAHGIPSGR